ncbi:hypothetical protein [Serinicoccus profundi]|uniref:hypothetical protein n=1 Tax=Serinicoccus profundi TaxID=1078471 RepID=UPI000255E75D|nr:hypothetical protein [Serinicoccus profundi]
MSEQTSTPSGDDQEGTFVGGTFDTPEDPASTAQEIESEQDADAPLAHAGEVPAAVQEQVTEPSGASEALAADVEGIATEEAPGDRNEPV